MTEITSLLGAHIEHLCLTEKMPDFFNKNASREMWKDNKQ